MDPVAIPSDIVTIDEGLRYSARFRCNLFQVNTLRSVNIKSDLLSLICIHNIYLFRTFDFFSSYIFKNICWILFIGSIGNSNDHTPQSTKIA